MSFALARGLISHLIAFSMCLQGIELLQMFKSGTIAKIWKQANLESEVARFKLLKQDESFFYLAWAEITIGAGAFLHPSALAFFLLFVAHVLACVRFRGSINGGSDAMTAIVLVGCSAAFLFKTEKFGRLGLIWIAIHLLLSYFKAGIAKSREPQWRNGAALVQFLRQSFFAESRALGLKLEGNPLITKYLGWGTVVFEIALAFSPLAPRLMPAAFLSAILFHFAIYWMFGLNRFFWAWMAAWPSAFYLSTLIHNG